MNEQELRELKKKLAEFAGFEYNRGSWWSGYKWGEPLHYFRDYPPDFPLSLDACFKWPMKQVREKLGEKEYFKFVMRWVLHMQEGREALALCLAIEKLIDGGE